MPRVKYGAAPALAARSRLSERMDRTRAELRRAMADTTQAEVAGRIGMKPSNFSYKLTRGRFTWEEMLRLIDALDIPAESVLRMTGAKNAPASVQDRQG